MHGLPAGYPLCGSPLNWPSYISTFLFELWVELFVLRVFPCSSAGESHVAPSSAEGPRASTPSVVLVVATAPAVVLGLVEPPPPPLGLSLLGAVAALIAFTCSTCSLLFLANFWAEECWGTAGKRARLALPVVGGPC